MGTLVALRRMMAIGWNGLLWCLQIFAAFVSVYFGLAELLSSPAMVEMFTVLGLPQWLRYVIGSLELVGGVALLFSEFCAIGAVLLLVVWGGLLITDLIATGYASVETTMLVVTTIIAWGRRDRLPLFLGGRGQASKASGIMVWRSFNLRYALSAGLAVAMVGGLLYWFQTAEWGSADQAGAAAHHRDDYPKAIALYTKGLHEAQLLPFSTWREVTSLDHLGTAYMHANQLTEAEATFRRAIELSRESLGPNHPLYYQSVHGLAAVIHRQSRYAEAEALYLQTIANQASVPPPPVEGILVKVCQQMARFSRWTNNAALAAEWEAGAKQIVDSALNKQALGLPDMLDGLANLYSDQGDLPKAEMYYRRALTLKGEILGRDVPDLGQRLLDLGLVIDDQGRPVEGLGLYEKVRALLDHVGVKNRRVLAESLNHLAETYRKQGRYTEAEPLYHLSLSILQASNYGETSSYASILTNSSILYYTRGRYAEAELKLFEAQAIRERSLRPNHPELAQTYNNLGLLYDYQDKHDEAESFYQRALVIRESELGPTHHKTILTLRLLSKLYFRQQQWQRAEPLYERLIRVQEQKLGAGHPTVINLLWTLAGIYSEQGKYADALTLYERFIPVLEEQYGPNNPALIPALTSYAYVLRKNGRLDEAARVEERIKALDPSMPRIPPE